MTDSVALFYDFAKKADDVRRLKSSMRPDEQFRLNKLYANRTRLKPRDLEWLELANSYFEKNGFLTERFEKTVDGLLAKIYRQEGPN